MRTSLATHLLTPRRVRSSLVVLPAFCSCVCLGDGRFQDRPLGAFCSPLFPSLFSCICVFADFAAAFSPQEGTPSIYERYTEGKAQAKDCLAIVTARVAAEERYAKEMAAVAGVYISDRQRGVWFSLAQDFRTLLHVAFVAVGTHSVPSKLPARSTCCFAARVVASCGVCVCILLLLTGFVSCTAKAHSLTDSGSLTTAWLSIREIHTALAEIHSTFAKKLQSEVARPLSDDIRDRSTQKNALADEDRNLHLHLNKCKAATDVRCQWPFLVLFVGLLTLCV